MNIKNLRQLRKLKILILLLASLSYLHAGGYELPYNGPKDALEYYKNGGIVDVFPLGPSVGWDTFPKELLEIPTLEDLSLQMHDTIPEEIVKLKNLRKLSIWGSSANLILPKSIAKMKKLKYLNIEDRNIENLEQICTYTQIETLELKSVDLKELPECIGQLMNLKELDLSDNQLEYLPRDIVKLKRLQSMSLLRNPELQKKGVYGLTAETEDYFPNPEVWEIKTIEDQQVFGEKYAWKDSIERLKPAFKGNEDYVSKIRGIKADLEHRLVQIVAEPNLRIRDSPGMNSKVIGFVPYLGKALRYKMTTYEDTIDGLTSPWYKIQYLEGNKIYFGWVFGGYLEKFVPRSKS